MSAFADLDPARFAELRRLLDEGLDLPPAERAAWLDALPAAQQPLRERLERLLAESDADDGDAFQTLPPLAEPAATPPESPGDIGPWRPLRLLGEGGMGTVWLAERIDGLLKRPAALKLPRGAWRQAGLAERMARERDILARLDHPHIAPILDAGVTPEGQPWLALAYVEGQPIDEYVAAHSLGLRERIGLLLQVAGAVAHAHARLVVHRDLKPGNILVTPQGEVRLLDFGIGKLLGDEAAEGLALTQQLGRVMTPWYASPEQVQGQPIGTASDVYALGVVAFELLTGRRPYALKQETRVELERAIVEGRTQRPSAVADTPWAAQLRGDLDTVLLKALKTAPDERYRTVDQFADDLQRWLRQRPVSAQPDRLAYRVRKFVSRNRLGVGLGAAAVAALAVALGVALWQREQARLEAAKANGIKDYLVSLFETNDVDQADALRKRRQSVQDLLEQGARTLGTGLAGQPEVRDELQRLVGQLLHDLELGDSALQVRRERAEALERGEAEPSQRVDAWRALAQSQYALDDAAGARATLERAVTLCGGRAEVACLAVQTDLGQMEFDARHLEAAQARVRPAVQGLRTAAPDSGELAAALDLLGNIELALNRPEAADALLQSSMAIQRHRLGEHSARLAALRYRLARNLWVMRQLTRADQEFRLALDTSRRALGDDHLMTLRIQRDLGRLVAYVGVHDDGLPMLRQAAERILAQRERVAPTEQLDAHVALGNALLLDGQLAPARAELQLALQLRDAIAGDRVWADATLDQSWGRLLSDQGDYAGARRVLEALLRRTIEAQGPDHPQVIDRTVRLAAVAQAEGRLDEATRLIEQVLARHAGHTVEFGSPRHRAVLALASLHLAQGRLAEALPPLEEAFARSAREPRAEQFRDRLFELTLDMARLRCAQRQFSQARTLFEQALGVMSRASDRHPALIDVRTAYAACLADQRLMAPARQQLAMAQAIWSAQPGLGAHWQRRLKQTAERLEPSP